MNLIKDKSFSFALDIIKCYKSLLTEKKEYVMSKQLLRSGTAIGALYREAEHAESKADFIHKMAMAQKESNETLYWIDLLKASEYIDKDVYCALKTKNDSINKIISSIILTTKSRKG
ncbi:four helix bundle protein [Robertkochia sediminum]|uniref:four helix bundle protein n=1 Tax=Robertkochia sediminum TaxID=2785326 RepID=UPI0019332784|nr:four helix bundle protein [Robertkochia sediminum]MBL7473759.1 four helix bundle protein [Robertkochia sediminum]